MNLGQVIDVEMIKGMVGTYQLDEGQWGQCSHEIMAQRQTLHHALDAGQHHASPRQPGADQHCADGSRYLHTFLSDRPSEYHPNSQLTEVPLSVVQSANKP